MNKFVRMELALFYIYIYIYIRMYVISTINYLLINSIDL